ncbi:extracellular solute-binding protein [Thermobacillus sp.]|uniref:ABC transporter substrate-binding protein n=1 Tax=Thermobacillus sp. TaxID=2108467 RepID=UPI00257AA19F|nr:extracellular solute-binding protein [Thermobacillus sp.]
MKKGPVAFMACICLLLVLAGCGSNSQSADNGNTGATETAQPDNSAANGGATEADTITLKLFTALADRSNGAGKVEQQIIDNFMKEHPNVKIEVEALQDEPYKNKIKVYAASDSMPDIMQVWGQPVFMNPLIDADLLLELDPNDFGDKKFVPGAMDGFSKNGKLYGLPRNTDFFVLFYNKKIFADNGVKTPATLEELKEVSQQLRAKGINPIAVNGMDGWPLPIWFEYALQRETGDFDFMDRAMSGEASFNDPAVVNAAKYMQELAQEKALADGFLTADYGAARNLFGQEKAAMYLMGAWEAGLATDENFSESFRQNVGALPYPASDKGKLTDVAAWFGGGYAVSKTTKHPEEAVAFLKYFFDPQNWAKLMWQSGAGFPAQQFDEFLTGEETNLQKDLIGIFGSMTSSSNTPVLDTSTDKFKQDIMSLHQKLLSGNISPEEFAKQLDHAAAEARK